MDANNEWARERLIKRAEQYIEDAKQAKQMGWIDCAKSKLEYAEFCATLAEHIKLGVQEF